MFRFVNYLIFSLLTLFFVTIAFCSTSIAYDLPSDKVLKKEIVAFHNIKKMDYIIGKFKVKDNKYEIYFCGYLKNGERTCNDTTLKIFEDNEQFILQRKRPDWKSFSRPD